MVSPARPVKNFTVIEMHPNKYLTELAAEKDSMDSSFVHAVRLLAEGKSCVLIPSQKCRLQCWHYCIGFAVGVVIWGEYIGAQ